MKLSSKWLAAKLMHFTILSPWSNTQHSVEPATYVDNFLPNPTGFFSIYCSTASFEKKGSFTMRFSSFTKSMRSANSGSLFSFLLIPNTFLDHLSLMPPGSSDSSMHITSGVPRTFQVCIRVIVSHFNRKFRNLLYPSASPCLTCGQCFISFR